MAGKNVDTIRDLISLQDLSVYMDVLKRVLCALFAVVLTLYVRVPGHEQHGPPQCGRCSVCTSIKQISNSCQKVSCVEINIHIPRFLHKTKQHIHLSFNVISQSCK